MLPWDELTDSTVIVEEDVTCVPTSKAKRLKKDHVVPSRGVRAQESIIMNMFMTPENRFRLRPTLERLQFHPGKTPGTILKGPSLVKSTVVGKFTLKLPSAMTNRRVTDPKRETDIDRRWREIRERAESLRNRRIARIQESAIRKMQEKEKQKKIEMLKRRAIRTNLRKEKERIFVVDRAKRPENKLNGISFDPVPKQSSPVSPNVKVLRSIFCEQKLPEQAPKSPTVNFKRTPMGNESLKENEMKCSLNKEVAKVDSTSKGFKPSDRNVNQHEESFQATKRASGSPVSVKSQSKLHCGQTGERIKQYENQSTLKKSLEVLHQTESRKCFKVSSETPKCLSQVDVPAQITPTVKIVELGNLVACKINESALESGHFNKLKDLEGVTRDSTYITEVEKHPQDEMTSATYCNESKPVRPVIRRVKRRLGKPGNNEIVTEPVNVPQQSNISERRKESLGSSSAQHVEGIRLTSLQLKKIELKKRLEDRLRVTSEKPCTEKIEKPPNRKSSSLLCTKNSKGCFSKKIVKGVKFRSKSSISLKCLPTKNAKKSAPLSSVRKTSSVCSSSDFGSSATENKISGDIKDSKKNDFGSHKKRHPRRRQSSHLESYETPEAAATTESFVNRLHLASQRDVHTSRSAITTEDMSSVSSAIPRTTSRGSTHYQSEDDTLPQTVSTEIFSSDTNGQSRKEDRRSIRQITVSPQPRLNNTALLRARCIEKARRTQLKRNMKNKEDNNCQSLPSSPRACPPRAKQEATPQLSKSQPPTPR